MEWRIQWKQLPQTKDELKLCDEAHSSVTRINPWYTVMGVQKSTMKGPDSTFWRGDFTAGDGEVLGTASWLGWLATAFSTGVYKQNTNREKHISIGQIVTYFLYICLSRMRFVMPVKCEFTFCFLKLKWEGGENTAAEGHVTAVKSIWKELQY